jgi:prepilin-type N-terminal cleavage/methylation domain-containing protein
MIYPTSIRKPRQTRGFTLVELLVVIVIIAALAGISFTAFRSIRAKSNEATASSNMRQIGVAIQTFVADKGRYPGDLFGTDEFNIPWDRQIMNNLASPDFDFKAGGGRPVLKGSEEAAALGTAAKIFYSPGDNAKIPKDQLARSYAICPWTATQGGSGFQNGFNLPIGTGAPASRVDEPHVAVLLVEHQTQEGRTPNVVGTGAYEHMFGFTKQPQRSGPANYHGTNQLLLFVDGHVAQAPGDITADEWVKKGYSAHLNRDGSRK